VSGPRVCLESNVYDPNIYRELALGFVTLPLAESVREPNARATFSLGRSGT
jgi:hypothetical protein